MKVAVLDLGTVSVRFEIYQIDLPNDHSQKILPNCVYRDRRMLRLGEALYKHQQLNQTGLELARQAFIDYRKIITDFEVDKVLIAATSALRDAKEGAQFISTLENIVSAPIKILSGQEEAEITALGILAHEKQLPKSFSLLDIGGGSTEISVFNNQTIEFSISINIGAIRCNDLFLSNSSLNKAESIETLRKHISSELGKHCSFQNPPSLIIGSGGSVRTLCRVKSGRIEHESVLSKKDVENILSSLIPLSNEDIAKIPGMEANRADLILSGGIIVDEVMKHLNAKELRPTKYSLRHGLIVSWLKQ